VVILKNRALGLHLIDFNFKNRTKEVIKSEDVKILFRQKEMIDPSRIVLSAFKIKPGKSFQKRVFLKLNESTSLKVTVQFKGSESKATIQRGYL